MSEYTSDSAAIVSGSRFCQLKHRGELPCIDIHHPAFSAAILLQGAQLLSYVPAGEPDWIWLSEQAEYRHGVSVRGGIPVCWPWFGNAAMNPADVRASITSSEPPAHGFARSREWQLQDLSETDDSVVITLSLDAPASSLWQADARAELRFTLSASALQLDLTTTAGSTPFVFTQALHTYFPTDDIRQTRIGGVDEYRYTDALDDWQEKIQKGDVQFSGETDRIYSVPATLTLHTPGRTLALNSNSHSAVIWNPWIEKSQRLSQFADDAWQRMYCVETANALHDCVSLDAGMSCTLSMKLYRG